MLVNLPTRIFSWLPLISKGQNPRQALSNIQHTVLCSIFTERDLQDYRDMANDASSQSANRSPQRSVLQRPDGANVHYHIVGNGPQPVLLLAPGGVQSQAAWWDNAPWNPLHRLDPTEYTMIAMDQRYSWEGSVAADELHIDWITYRDDQMALLDHLGITTCHLVASCIGPSFGLQLLRDFPSRFEKAVWMQPIGLSHHTTEPVGWEGTNRGVEQEHWFGEWARYMVQNGRAQQRTMDRMHANMFAGKDFCFTITRDDLKRMDRVNEHKMLVLCGRDIFHPAEIAREIARLAPRSTVKVIEEWRNVGPSKLEEANSEIQTFLRL